MNPQATINSRNTSSRILPSTRISFGGASAEQAVAQLGQQYFDVILTDYEIGEPNGAWLLEYVFEHHEHMHRGLIQSGGDRSCQWRPMDRAPTYSVRRRSCCTSS